MPAIVVRNISAKTHRALRVRARQHGRSTEAEIRAILDGVVRPRLKLGSALAALVKPFGGLELEIKRDKKPAKPANPDRSVLTWLDAQSVESLYLATVSLSELLLGIAGLRPANAAVHSPVPSTNRSSRCSPSGSCPSISLGQKPTRRLLYAHAGMVIRSLLRTPRLRPLPHPVVLS